MVCVKIVTSCMLLSITCTGTFFYFLEETAHLCLSISEDGFTIFYGDEELPISAMALDDSAFTRCSKQPTQDSKSEPSVHSNDLTLHSGA